MALLKVKKRGKDMKYEKPCIEIMELDKQDIVCASGLNNGGSGDVYDWIL